MNDQLPGPSEEPSEGTLSDDTPRRYTSSRKVRVYLIVLSIVAGAIGFAHALNQGARTRQSSFVAVDCHSLAGARIHDRVVINETSQPISYILTEEVSLPRTSPLGHELANRSDTVPFEQAKHCLFTPSITGTPFLVSSAHGRNTFSASTTASNGASLFPEDGWTVTLHEQGVRLFFHPQVVCSARKNLPTQTTNWTESRLTLTVVTEVAPRYLAPLPSRHKDQSYSWYSTKATCDKLSHIALTVPTSLVTYLSSIAYKSTIGGVQVNAILGWSYPILVVALALALYFYIRRFLGEQRFIVNLVFLAFLGLLLAAINLDSSSNGLWSSTELIVVYGFALIVILRLRSARGWVTVAGAVVALMAIIVTASRARTTILPDVAMAQETIALVLLIAIGVLACRVARSFQLSSKSGIAPWANIDYLRDIVVFWTGAALAITLSYSLGNLYSFSTSTNFIFSVISTLQYPLAAFAVVLVAATLVVPLVSRGLPADGPLVIAALFGFSFVAQLPALTVPAIVIPGGEVLFVFFLYRFAVNNRMLTCDGSTSSPAQTRKVMPKEDSIANAILAIKIGATLAVIPVAYFFYTTVITLPKTLQQPGPGLIFAVAGILGQLLGWIIVGLVFAVLTPCLRGGVGPVRALIVSAAWFAAAFIVHIVDHLMHQPTARSWSFFGLELLLFLVAFGVIWDAYVLTDNPWRSSLQPLWDAYRFQRVRTVIIYAVPLLLTIIVFGQQLSSGNGIESVKSALSVGPAFFGR